MFKADVTTRFGSDYYNPVMYQWDFGDNASMNSSVPTVTHTYTTPGSWNISVSVSNEVSSPVPFTGTVYIAKG